jgi:hypothetical protein
MTDEELGAEIYPDNPAEGAAHARLMAEKDPAKRAALVRLIEVGREVNLWQAGLGSKPVGVIVCGPRQIRERGR